ncbi:MAG: hypothetical protein QOJ60_2511 [Actinomycetota bacterium]|jgi:SAM-dependent methyltransferase|nr:hypothetical protein [Actinomycetota bacterium]
MPPASDLSTSGAGTPDVRPPTTSAARSVHTAVVWAALARVAAEAHEPLDVLDVGGGTGGLAVPMAQLGHRVTVVDPSPDALASLERRAGEAGVSVRSLQGDAAGLLDVVDPASADLALCHGVLEHVDDVEPALAALVAALRPRGWLSVLVANRHAVVLARAVAGHLAQARAALDDPDGRWGPGDPLPRRFGEDELLARLAAAGLTVGAVHGVRTLADLVPGSAVDHDSGTAELLLDLETATADHPAFRAVATQLHVLARRD